MQRLIKKVLVVEDEAIFRSLLCDYLKKTFGVESVLEGVDGNQGWDLFCDHRPDFCIIDLHLPKLRGEILIDLMQKHHEPPRILVLTAQPEVAIEELFHSTKGLLRIEKMAPVEKLKTALETLFFGKKKSQINYSKSDKQKPKVDSLMKLTLREKTILSMVGEGEKSEQIAEILGISVFTVRTHRRNLMRKLGIHSVALLVRYAMDRGLVSERR